MDFNPTKIHTDKFQKFFWNKVKKTDYCWNWVGHIGLMGYGLQTAYPIPTLIKTHRTSWVMHNGPIPKGMCVCHSCDNRRCVNPDHLWLGTPGQNSRDRDNKKRNARGEKNKGGGKLKWKDVREIRGTWIPYKFSKSKLALKYGVSVQMIKNIVYGRNWKE